MAVKARGAIHSDIEKAHKGGSGAVELICCVVAAAAREKGRCGGEKNISWRGMWIFSAVWIKREVRKYACLEKEKNDTEFPDAQRRERIGGDELADKSYSEMRSLPRLKPVPLDGT